jgi:hypothetical protein
MSDLPTPPTLNFAAIFLAPFRPKKVSGISGKNACACHAVVHAIGENFEMPPGASRVPENIRLANAAVLPVAGHAGRKPLNGLAIDRDGERGLRLKSLISRK